MCSCGNSGLVRYSYLVTKVEYTYSDFVNKKGRISCGNCKIHKNQNMNGKMIIDLLAS